MSTPAFGGRWEARRLLAILTASIMAWAVILMFGGTAQADSPATLPWDNAQNEASWWEDYGADTHGEDAWTCTKTNAGADEGDEAYVVGDPPVDHLWRLAVVKAGADIVDLHWDPLSGDELEHSVQGGWSWVTLCSRPGETTSSSVDDSSTSSSTPTETTPPTTAPSSTDSSVSETTVTTSPTSTDSSVSETTVTTAPTTTDTSVLGTTVVTDPTTSETVQGTVVTTAPTSSVDDLPLTGLETGTLLGLGVAMLGLGLGLLALTRRPQED